MPIRTTRARISSTTRERPDRARLAGGLTDAGDFANAAVPADSDRIDEYTVAHLSEAKVRIGQALDAQLTRNLDDIRIRLTLPTFMFGEQGEN